MIIFAMATESVDAIVVYAEPLKMVNLIQENIANYVQHVKVNVKN